MRVTQFTQYNNFILNQQKTLNELNNVQTQISTGVKIQNMYEDSVVYTKYLKLNEEINSFTQIKTSASFAKTFANETDTVLNEFVSTLGSFKTNLLKAANDTNDETSRNAIVSELEGELAHLKDLANTSIDGKYLFSGSKFNTKPIDDNYQYQGNAGKVKAFLGAGVEREYNIDGASLFLGRDNDYSKHISTNVVQFDKMKANPQFVVRGSDGKLYIDKHMDKDKNGNKHISIPDSEDVPVNEVITGESQIRMLTGVEDVDNGDGTYSDGISYFYIKGKKPNGELIDTKIPLSNSATVNDLLEKIGEVYGNTATSKNVDVSLNDMGQIQIKDSASGKMITDFYMVASDKDEAGIDDLVKNGDYIVEFQKSNFNAIKNLSGIKANNSYFDNRIFKFGSVFKTIDTKREALPSDTLFNVLGDTGVRDNDGTIQNLDHLTLTGTDTKDNSVDVTLNIDSSTTMQDLIDEIKNSFGDVSVSLQNGELVISDNSISDTESSNLSVNINAFDSDNNSLQVFASKDIANFEKLYMNKNANEINSNVSQIVKDYKTIFKDGEKIINKNPNAQTYATEETSIADTMGIDEMPQEIKVKFRDQNGELKKTKIELRDSTFSKKAEYEADSNNEIIYDASGNSNISSKYYDTVGTDVIDESGKKVTVAYLKVSDGSTTDTIAIDENTTFEDIVNSTSLLSGYNNGKFITANSDVTITLEDKDQNDIIAGFKSTYQIDLNNDGQIGYGEIFNIFEPDGSLTPAHDIITTTNEIDTNTCAVCKKETLQKGMTYRQLGDVVSMLTSGNLPASNNNVDDYNKAINTAKEQVTAGMDFKGRFYLKDNSNNPSKIDLIIYTDNNSLYFQANNAVTVDEPQVDFFETLQKAIDAVKNGNLYPESEINPRSFGIEGAIEAIDHVTDHIRRSHAKIGAVSNEFGLTIERVNMLTLNVQQLQSDNIDTDLGEATMRLNSLQTSYQALLASIAKINNITLLNYL